MTTPLDIAVDIGRIVHEAQSANLRIDLCSSADDIVSRFPQSGLSRGNILAALAEEAGAAGINQD